MTDTFVEKPLFLNTEFDEQTIRTFVGDADNYYIRKWSQVKNPETDISWNWVAFVIPVMWLAYRKQFEMLYLLMLGSFGLSFFLASTVLPLLPGDEGMVRFILVVVSGLIIRIPMSLYANMIYYRHMLRKLRKVAAENVGTERYEQMVRKAGGYSYWGIAVVFLINGILRSVGNSM